MDFTMASQMRAQKLTRESKSTMQNVQKGTGERPSVGLDSMSVAKATSVPGRVNSTAGSVMRGDHKIETASFENDKVTESGEFESAADESTADTGFSGDAVRETESGEFESAADASTADSGHDGDAVRATESGEFESAADESTADTGHGGAQVRETESGEFSSTPEASHTPAGAGYGEQEVEVRGVDADGYDGY